MIGGATSDGKIGPDKGKKPAVGTDVKVDLRKVKGLFRPSGSRLFGRLYRKLAYLGIFFASSAILQVNQWVEFYLLTFPRFPLRKNEHNPYMVRIELTTSALAGVQVTYETTRAALNEQNSRQWIAQEYFFLRFVCEVCVPRPCVLLYTRGSADRVNALHLILSGGERAPASVSEGAVLWLSLASCGWPAASGARKSHTIVVRER